MYITCILHKHSLIFVSFQSIFSSYKFFQKRISKRNSSFHLLSEFNSLLSKRQFYIYTQIVDSFRLLSEFNSLLLTISKRCKTTVNETFPSPFGVQFSFMLSMFPFNDTSLILFPSPFGVQFSFILPKLNPYFIVYYFIIFVRILEIFIFLFLNNKKYTLTPIFKVSWRLLKKIIIFVFNFI